MITIQEHLHMIPLSEFRADLSILAEIKQEDTLILTKKGKPIAVLLNFEEYQRQQNILDDFYDTEAGSVAQQRDLTTKKEEYLSEKQLYDTLGL